MLRLRPYNPLDAQQVIRWIKDEVSFKKWSADRLPSYPPSAEDVNAFYSGCGENFFAMTAFDDEGVEGQLTMRFMDEEKTHLRLGFIIVNDEKRGRGYGKGMVTLALKYAFDILKVRKVSLGVFENNPSAMHCYRSVGLRETGDFWVLSILGEDWKCIEMAVEKEEYYENI